MMGYHSASARRPSVAPQQHTVAAHAPPITYGFYFRTHIALVHRRTTSTTSILKTTSSTSFTWTWDGFTATLRSSHGLASSRRWRVFRRPHGRVFLRQAGGAPRHRLSLNAEEYSMVVILRMNRAFMEYMRKHEKDYEPGK